MMSNYESQQQSPLQNPQLWGQVNPQLAQALGQQIFGQQAGGYGNQGQLPGLGQAAYGQPYGQFGGQQFGQPSLGAWGQQQRQLSPQDASEVVRQLIPLLPQIIAQAQQPPQAAFGYGQRMLTQQDVNEVVRQILPIVPQIAAQLQGQPQVHAVHAGYSGPGQQAQMGTTGQTFQQPFGQQAWPQVQAAFGGFPQGIGQTQRQLTQQDVSEVVRQLVGAIPQLIHNQQSNSQQRTN